MALHVVFYRFFSKKKKGKTTVDLPFFLWIKIVFIKRCKLELQLLKWQQL